jgi:PLD-like domain
MSFELLTGDAASLKIKQMAHDGDRIRIAVPFWGAGAAKKLVLGRARQIEVLCNLDSQGCNPAAILELKALENNHRSVIVKTNWQLHAKIYAGGNSAIIGSSNASANGLLFDIESTGWLEANVYSVDSGFVDAAHRMFELFFNDPLNSVEVTLDMIKNAEERWERRTRIYPPQAGEMAKRTLSEIVKSDDKTSKAQIKTIFVALSEVELNRVDKNEIDAANQEAGFTVDDEPGYWGFRFDKNPVPESWIISLWRDKNSKEIVIEGVCKFDELTASGLQKCHRYGAIVFSSVNRIKLSSADKKALRAWASSESAKMHKFVPLEVVFRR